MSYYSDIDNQHEIKLLQRYYSDDTAAAPDARRRGLCLTINNFIKSPRSFYHNL